MRKMFTTVIVLSGALSQPFAMEATSHPTCPKRNEMEVHLKTKLPMGHIFEDQNGVKWYVLKSLPYDDARSDYDTEPEYLSLGRSRSSALSTEKGATVCSYNVGYPYKSQYNKMSLTIITEEFNIIPVSDASRLGLIKEGV